MPDDSTTLTLDAGENGSVTFDIDADDLPLGSNEWSVTTNDTTVNNTLYVSDDPDYIAPDEGDMIGVVHATINSTTVALPVYEPEDVQYPCWRVAIPDWDEFSYSDFNPDFDDYEDIPLQMGAFEIRPRSEANRAGLCIQTSGGIYAIHDSRIDDDDENGDDPDPDPDPDPAYFDVEINDYDSTVDEGETAEIQVIVTNEGEESGEQDIYLDNETTNNRVDTYSNLSLGTAPSSDTIVLEWSDTEGNDGSNELVVSTSGDGNTDSVYVTVEEEVTDPDPGVTIIDSFEHQDLSANYSNGTSNYEITNDFAVDSNLGLRHRVESYTGGMLRSLEGDGLDYYPSEGDKIVWYFQIDTDATSISSDTWIRFKYGMDGQYNFYMAQMRVENYRYTLIDTTSGTEWQMIDDTGWQGADPFEAGRRYRAEVEWGANTHTFQVFDDQSGDAMGPQLSGTPNNHSASSGGIEIVHQSNDGSTQIYSDHYHVEDD